MYTKKKEKKEEKWPENAKSYKLTM